MHLTWLSFYVQKSHEPSGSLSVLDNKPLDVFDQITQSFTSKPELLQLYIAGNAFNFFLVPGGAKNVRILHHVFITALQPDVSPIAISLYGNRKGTAVFKQLMPHPATNPMTPLEAPITRSPDI
jgi:hypothetical protein